MTPSSAHSKNWPENWQDLVAGYASGDLSPAEAEAFQQLLETQPDIAAEVEQFQSVVELMRHAPAEQDPPAYLRDQILRQAELSPQSEQPLQPAFLRQRPQTGWRMGWRRMGGAIAVIVIIALALDDYFLRRSLQQTQPLAELLRQPNIQLYAMKGTKSQLGASASLVIHTEQATIVTQNLSTLPAGKAYRLWAIVESNPKPVLCGQFNSAAAQSVVEWQLPSPSCKAPKKWLITAELASALPVPSGPLVLQ
jgi:anti-sigma-K factor RskA